jgi:DNA-binding beta-propeller fold protein YncE
VITPHGEWVYVTDARTDELSVIELQTRKIVARVFVGYGAHHLSVGADEQRAWVALGESATTIVTLDTSTPNRPRLTGRVRLSTAHDLAFAPDTRTVWLTSAKASYVSVLDATTHRQMGTVPAGRAPQHIVFLPYGHPAAFITSGYGSSIEMVNTATRKVIRRSALPYGSFNLVTSGGLVVTSSLLDGYVTEFNGTTLARWMNVNVAPRARDVAISVW